MKISVIIPSYKPQDYLWECLGSMKNQTFPHDEFEVILVLNGTREPFFTNIEMYIKDTLHGNTNIKLFYLEQGNVSIARNIALDHAVGDYITFVDDDDYVSPIYLEELYKHATPNVISLCYPLSFVDGTDFFKPFLITLDYVKNIGLGPCHFTKARRFFSGPVYKLIHRDVIGNRRFNKNFRNGEDSIFMFEISDKFHKVDFTSQKAVYYRRVRNGSALLRKKSTIEIVLNCMRMMFEYSAIFIRHPFRYSLSFYFTRLLGVIHGVIEQFQLRKGKSL